MTVNELVNAISALGEGGAAQAFNQLETINVSILNSILLLVRMNGHDILYMGLVLVAGFLSFRSWRINPQSRRVIPLTVYLFSQFAMFVIVLFGGSGAVSYWRSMASILLISPVMMGFLGSMVMKNYIFRTIKNMNPRKLLSVTAATSVIFFSYTIGVFGFFPSPGTFRLNQQISSAELSGMEWLANNRDNSIPVDSITIKFVFPSALKRIWIS